MLGPTASGKSEIALRLAEELDGEIVSVDSMQVYRHMDIGTAKPDRAEQDRVPHHMIDLVEPEELFTAAEFQTHGRRVLADLADRNTVAVVVGGSGLHFRALIDPLEFPPRDEEERAAIEAKGSAAARAELLAADPAAGGVVDLDNPRRVQRAVEVYRLTGRTPTERATGPEAEAIAAYRPLLPFRAVGVDPGAELSARIERRLQAMLERGFLSEVAALAGRLGPTAGGAVGYKQLLPVVRGECGETDGIAAARRATLSLAKRQRTYFRRDPRIDWVPWTEDTDERYRRVRRSLLETAT